MHNTIHIFDPLRIIAARAGALLAAAGLALGLTTVVLRGAASPNAPVASLSAQVASAHAQGEPARTRRATFQNRVDGGERNDVLRGDAGDDLLHGFGGDDLLSGGAGADVLIGGSGEDVLHGDVGDDRLVGNAGRDTLSGGEGDDVLEGGEGDDTYMFAGHFGHDIVRERARQQSGRDVLVFEDLREADARILREADDLLVRDKHAGDSVRVEGFFAAEHRRVEALRFADGAEASLSGLSEGPRVLMLASN